MPHRLDVFVGLAGQPKDLGYMSAESSKTGAELVESYLSEPSAENFNVVRKGLYYFVINTDKATAKKLFDDERVRVVNDTQLYSSRIKISIN